ncbi:LacI family transcriptional regulator/LacI family repressor for deo operon, udp, cdd, tsx, nupC, and nupG [Hydrogenispora ethanolica]|uniref:LacI family transcriptional regulator/LacI family repressor for deo operon, udp, cdd, tsx, nupC, and nupG n=1 Tax=Hydrogenispora ethanolica TaxID=1082276 RepID=A0A4R1R0I9_HYDET|nr:LacI family DNA-binding transcriptional regulator [Hydrogenispora ethanolica]TCL58810.1 LacI family transcriptional regulator/LacI family repressor for deo operon, udp, cdd, tsx, nupC, and nupG [Hydrogenispora ethanolica]
MTTLKDIATHLNISIATVSRVLNNKAGLIGITDETKQKVLEAAKLLNYQPDLSARNLRLGRSLRAILFIYTYPEKDKYGTAENMFFPHPFFSHLLHGVQLGVQKKGYYVSYLSATEQTIESLSKLFDNEINGVISWGQLPGNIRALIRDKRLPLVGIEPYLAPEDIRPAIYVHNELLMSQALEHLVKLGHRRIGFISLKDEAGAELSQFKDRREAFLRLLPRFGLEPFSGQEMFGIVRPGVHEYTPGKVVARQWLETDVRQRPTAIITGNDLLAVGAIRTLRNAGLSIPGDLSIVGTDDIDWSEYNEPPLTTVRIPKEQMGELAVALLERLMRGKEVRRNSYFIKTGLIVRATTGPCREGGDGDQ